MLEKSARIILCDLNKLLVCISFAILICATTAKAKHTRMCDNLISVYQNSARGKQRTQLALLKYSHFFLALRSTKTSKNYILCVMSIIFAHQN